MLPRSLALSGLLLLSAGGLGTPLAAQAVRGTVSDPATGEPLWGAVVVLLEGAEGEARAAGVIADQGGRYLIRAPGPGTYRLRAERIGFRSITTPPFALGAEESLHRDLRAPVQAVALEEIRVVGESQCRDLGEDANVAYRLWEEARKALVATVITADMDAYRFDAALWERRLHPRRLRVEEEERRTTEGRGRHPFRSVSAASLAEAGWVQETSAGTMYYGPDAQLLLSESFMSDHCFLAREGEEPGTVGLGFRPIPRREVPEIAGTLWLDAESAELRHLEYRYVNLDLPVRTDAVGGRVEFDRLPDGGWIVRRWWIRMPAIAVERTRTFDPRRAGPAERERAVLAGLKEDGGELIAVRREDGSLVRSYGRAALSGQVTNGTGGPVSGATVRLSGTALHSRTDATGRFELRELPEGRYRATFDHPQLDLLGVRPEGEEVELRDGELAEVELELPPWREALAEACRDRWIEQAEKGDGEAGPAASSGVLVGRVRTATDGTPVEGATVTMSWESVRLFSSPEPEVQARDRRRVETRTDERGVYRVCGLPSGRTVTVRAVREGRVGQTVTVGIPGERCDARDCGVPVGPAAPQRAARLGLGPGVVRQDLILGAAGERGDAAAEPTRESHDAAEATGGPDAASDSSAELGVGAGARTARLMGQVVDASTGQPISSARVSLEGTGLEAVTDERGRFALGEVPAGARLLRVEHLAYGTRAEALEVRPGQALAVTFRMAAEAVPVEPILVTVMAEPRRRELATAGFYDRQARGRGFFITREDLEEKRAVQFSDALRGVPGVEVIPVGTSYRIRMRSALPSIVQRDCPVQIYLDGMLWNTGAPPDDASDPGWTLDDVVRIENIAGIEVYPRASQIPARFRASKNARCGVVVVWTRER